MTTDHAPPRTPRAPDRWNGYVVKLRGYPHGYRTPANQVGVLAEAEIHPHYRDAAYWAEALDGVVLSYNRAAREEEERSHPTTEDAGC